MIKHNIFILEFNSLYQILNEINDYFSFELININLSKLDNLNLSNSIILSKINNKDYLINKKKINKNNVIFFVSEKENYKELHNFQTVILPTNILNLIEKINIHLIKKNYNEKSNIKISDYNLDLNSRTISKNGLKLKLTEKEIDIILFLNNNNSPQKVSILQNKVWGYSLELETHTVETHIYRLRRKIADIFKDNNFIISEDEGYLIQ
jgi:DNA-binding response OmpR family regulator